MVRQEILDRSARLQQTPILDRVAAIKETLLAAGDEAQELRRLPDFGVQALIDSGVYRMVLPRELGGEDLRARQQIEVLEASSAIDGSIGWCVQINSEINALVLRQMEPGFAHQVCDDWHMLVCSGLGTPNGEYPGREATREGAGWRVKYQGAFASGSPHATWNLILTGETIDPATGKPAEAAFMIPKGEFEVIDTWDMAGMRGTGSHDVRVVGYVPPEHVLPQNALAPTTLWENPTYRNPVQVPYNKAGVALGIAKGAIADFCDLAVVKTPWMSGSMLKDQPEAHIRIGEAQATYLAARSFVMETQDAIEQHLGPLKGGRPAPDWEHTRAGLLASTHASQSSRYVVDLIHNTAGTTAGRMNHPLERRLRDSHQAAAHGGTGWRHYGNLGKTWLGHEPPGAHATPTRA